MLVSNRHLWCLFDSYGMMLPFSCDCFFFGGEVLNFRGDVSARFYSLRFYYNLFYYFPQLLFRGSNRQESAEVDDFPQNREAVCYWKQTTEMTENEERG